MKTKRKASAEEPVVLESAVTKKSQGQTKKILIIVLCAMLVLGAVSWFLLYIKPEILDTEKKSSGDDGNSVGMYGSQQSYIFYPANEELDADKISEYRELDRQIHYTYGAQTIALSDEAFETMGNDTRFFKEYFECVSKGDAEKYNTLFTDNYYESNEPYYSFAPQMLYDINIEKLSEDSDGNKAVYAYNVSYKIFRNNGTFRNDIGSGGSKTLYFELVEENGTVLIDKIDYYL